MPTFERETLVDAPLDRVWEFHSTIDGLRALTPAWMDLRVESIDRPESTLGADDVLTAGTVIRASVAPCWVLPRQHWTSVIDARQAGDGEYAFVDTMRGGPFSTWEHTHRFVAEGDRTRVVDHVEYAVPGGDIAALAVGPALDAFFAYRHRRTREILHDT